MREPKRCSLPDCKLGNLICGIEVASGPDWTVVYDPSGDGRPWLLTDKPLPIAGRAKPGRAFVGGFLACYLAAAGLLGTATAYGRPDISTGGAVAIGAGWPLALGLFAYRARAERIEGASIQPPVPDEDEGSPVAPDAPIRSPLPLDH